MVGITKEAESIKIESLKGQKSPHANPQDWQDRKKPDILVLFDVDGTLTPARKVNLHY